MKSINKASFFYYLLAIVISFIFFLNLKWDATHMMNENMDIYFGADVERVLDNLNDNGSFTHSRDHVHPYFSTVAVTVSKTATYLGYENVAFPVYKMVFGALGTFLFWLFVYKNTNAMQAFASLTLLLSTISLRVWATVPETFLFSFFTLMLALNLMRLKTNPVFILLATLAGTVTNLVLGLSYVILVYKNAKAILKVLLSFAIVSAMISIIQKNIYLSSEHYFDIFSQKEELNYIYITLRSTLFKVFDFFISGFIIPLNSEANLPATTADLWKSFLSLDLIAYKQKIFFTILTISSLIMVYSTALYAFFKSTNKNVINLSVLIFICFEFISHLIYGGYPFLYSLNFTPLIIIFISLNQPDQFKHFTSYILIYLAFLVQTYNYSDPVLFSKYFS